MNATCKAGALCAAVEAASRPVNNHATTPILSGLLLSIASGAIEVCGTNIETTVAARLPASPGGPGAVVVASASLLASYLKTLDGEESVALSTSAPGLTLRSGRRASTLRTLPAEDFPPLPNASPEPGVEEWHIRVAGADLRAAVTRACFCASSDEARGAVLMGTLLCVDRHGAASLTATDGFVLARTPLPTNGDPATPEAFIVPSVGLVNAARTLGGAERVDITVAGHGSARDLSISNYLTLASPEARVMVRLVDGRYPNVDAVIPANPPVTVDIARAPLLDALRRAGLVDVVASSLVRLSFEEGTLTISASSDEAGRALETLPLLEPLLGPAIVVGFSAKRLASILTHINTDTVRLGLSTPHVAMLVRPAAGDEIYVLMPVRIAL